MKKILVGYDGSEGAQQALMKARGLVNEDGEIVLLAVVPLPNEKTLLDKNAYKKLKQKAQQLIDDVVHTMGTPPYTITAMIEEGDAASTIIDRANSLSCDLIVLGSTGTSELGRYPLGSVANKVVQYAHKPVMVVR